MYSTASRKDCPYWTVFFSNHYQKYSFITFMYSGQQFISFKLFLFLDSFFKKILSTEYKRTLSVLLCSLLTGGSSDRSTCVPTLLRFSQNCSHRLRQIGYCSDYGTGVSLSFHDHHRQIQTHIFSVQCRSLFTYNQQVMAHRHPGSVIKECYQ